MCGRERQAALANCLVGRGKDSSDKLLYIKHLKGL